MKKQTLIFLTIVLLALAYFGGSYLYRNSISTVSQPGLIQPYAHVIVAKRMQKSRLSNFSTQPVKRAVIFTLLSKTS